MQEISPFGGRSSGKPKTQLPSGSFSKLGSMRSAVNTSFIIILNLTVKLLPTSCNPSGSSKWCCDRIMWPVLCCVWLDSKNLLFLAKETSYGLSMTKLPANLKHNKHIVMTKYVWTQNTRSYETQISCFFLPYENNLISECRNLEPGLSGHPGDEIIEKKQIHSWEQIHLVLILKLEMNDTYIDTEIWTYSYTDSHSTTVLLGLSLAH